MWVWVQPVMAISALLVAIAAGGAAVWKIWKVIDKAEDAWQVLSEIAEQFRPNGGNSLHDRIVTLEGSVTQIQKDIESVLIERPRKEPAVRAEVDEDDIGGTPI